MNNKLFQGALDLLVKLEGGDNSLDSHLNFLEWFNVFCYVRMTESMGDTTWAHLAAEIGKENIEEYLERRDNRLIKVERLKERQLCQYCESEVPLLFEGNCPNCGCTNFTYVLINDEKGGKKDE